ncbi:Sperm-associated antigen 16 protein [Entophlyctis sp. JEL0112]|nr:Sperm-associated antigen 16 protein [Entophlyctis sp. JEL0112]
METGRARSTIEEVPYEGTIINPVHYLECEVLNTVPPILIPTAAVTLDPDDSQSSDEENDAYNRVLAKVEEFGDVSDSDVDETLETAIRTMNETVFIENVEAAKNEDKPLQEKLTKRPEVVDDYIRNYFASKGLMKSLDAFQNEWYEFLQKGLLSQEDRNIVPDVYVKNQELSDALQKLRVDVDNYKEIASKARATYDKLRKERDFHRMHHKRVVQEKNRLIGDIKRLKKHNESFEPTLKGLRSRYETAMKEKMLIKLERDRVLGKLSVLEAANGHFSAADPAVAGVAAAAGPMKTEKDIARKISKESSQKEPPMKTKVTIAQPSAPSKKLVKESSLPVDDRPNIHANADLPTGKIDHLKQIHSIKAHSMAVSSIKFHPKKMILATVSDDRVWKLWAFPSGELIMSGEGHKDWIAECDFNPKGTHLATTSGDGTIKIWDFTKSQAALTLTDHTQAVWSCAFHDQGDFLATCSMDQTAKLWDIHTGKCRQTFRGHADSVNHVGFMPFTNTLYTCSGDKTLSLWDARTGLCTQTLYGHVSAINHMTVSLRGDVVASCDSDGIVKFWDIRNVSELETIDFGPHSANKVALDPAGNTLAVASNDGSVKL